VEEAGDGAEARDLVAALRPDMLLLDLVMPSPRPADIERWVRAGYPKTVTLILTGHAQEAFLVEIHQKKEESSASTWEFTTEKWWISRIDNAPRAVIDWIVSPRGPVHKNPITRKGGKS